MTNALQEAVQSIVDVYGKNRQMSIATLKDLGYVLGPTCLAITTTKDEESTEETIFKIHHVLTERGRYTKFSYLQKNDELDTGEIINKPFKYFQRL